MNTWLKLKTKPFPDFQDAEKFVRHFKSINPKCKYHIVFISKCRRKVLFGPIKRDLSDIFHSLARQKESLIEEGHLLSTIRAGHTTFAFLLRVSALPVPELTATCSM